MNLEQLIKACGDEFIELGHLPSDSPEFKWFATGANDDDEEYTRFYGSTPTEAVQKLYDYLKENNLLNN